MIKVATAELKDITSKKLHKRQLIDETESSYIKEIDKIYIDLTASKTEYIFASTKVSSKEKS